VSKTGRLVVVDEDYRSFGLSGEIAATIVENDQSMLKAPMARVTYPDMPVPYARSLEQAALPTRGRIEAAIRSVVAR
jgi:pyruvate dehydrogenase E1 component beta subunit